MALLRQGRSQLGAFIQSPLGVRGLGGFCPVVAMSAITTPGGVGTITLVLISKINSAFRVVSTGALHPTADADDHIYYTQGAAPNGVGKSSCEAVVQWDSGYTREGDGGRMGLFGAVGPDRVFARYHRATGPQDANYFIGALNKSDGSLVFNSQFTSPNLLRFSQHVAADDLGGCYFFERESSTSTAFMYYATPSGAVLLLDTFNDVSGPMLGANTLTDIGPAIFADGDVYGMSIFNEAGTFQVVKFDSDGVPVAYSTEIESLVNSPEYTRVATLKTISHNRQAPVIVQLDRTDSKMDLYVMQSDMTVSLLNTLDPIINRDWVYDGFTIYTQNRGTINTAVNTGDIFSVVPTTGEGALFFDMNQAFSGPASSASMAVQQA